MLLGHPYGMAIDMWSLGCMAAELFLGLPLFPGASEHDLLCHIVDMLGLPPAHVLQVRPEGLGPRSAPRPGGEPGRSDSQPAAGLQAGLAWQPVSGRAALLWLPAGTLGVEATGGQRAPLGCAPGQGAAGAPARGLVVSARAGAAQGAAHTNKYFRRVEEPSPGGAGRRVRYQARPPSPGAGAAAHASRVAPGRGRAGPDLVALHAH